MTEIIDDRILALAAELLEQSDDEKNIELIFKTVYQLIDADSASLVLINPQSGVTLNTIETCLDKNTKKGFANVREQVVGFVIQQKDALITANLQTDVRFPNLYVGDADIGSVIAAPARADNMLIGVVILSRRLRDKPFTNVQLEVLQKILLVSNSFLLRIQRDRLFVRQGLPEEELISKFEALGLFGKSQSHRMVLNSIESAANCNVTVLLQGASGTGKELVANAIHQLSERRHKAFIPVDCSALPETTINSELFGHVKGSFTGAVANRKGLFRAADGGTIFIDEIASLTEDIQSILLRVIESRCIRPVGGDQLIPIDVRVIVATNVPLLKLVRLKRFREDLYYRLNVFPMRLPELNERVTDIKRLANIFLESIAKSQHKRAKLFHDDLINLFISYHWPGNIRQLRNIVERLVVYLPEAVELVMQKHIPPTVLDEIFIYSHTQESAINLAEKVKAFEKHEITLALVTSGWNQANAAKILGVSPQTLHQKIKRLNIVKVASDLD